MSKKQLDLTNPSTLRAVARRAGVVADRRYSQNFLIDRDVVDRILRALDPTGQTVLEIGPGMGTLTQDLVKLAARVVAIEIDPACIRAVELTLRQAANLELIEADARDVDFAQVLGTQSWLAVGNLPYHLTGALIATVFEREQPPDRAVFLVQREVARRLAADQGDWSLATVAVRSIANVEVIQDVPPMAFEPSPKVHSSIIRMTPSLAIKDADERKMVLKLAKRAFQMRRKTLRQGLGQILGGDLSLAVRLLESADIDSSRRPGTLNLDEWRRLAKVASKHGS